MKLKTIIFVTMSFLLTIIFSLFLASFKSATAQVCPGGLWWYDPNNWPVNTITMTSSTKNYLMPSPIYVLGSNVGVGTRNPVYKLQVEGSISGSRLCIGSDCRDSWPTGGGGSGGGITTINAANVSSGQFGANTGGGNYYFMGSVGIGTTTPSYRVHVQGGDIYASGYIRGRSGLCIGSDCRTSWPNEAGGAINITGGSGLTASPDPITASGTISLNISGISSCTATTTQKIIWDSTNKRLICATDQTGSGAGGISGSGSPNYITKWTASTTLGNSIIYDNGTNIGIGTTNPISGKLVISGGNLDITGNRIINVATPINASDGVNKAYVDAQSDKGYPGLGTAMMVKYMADLGLFTPHSNNCDSSEAFVPLWNGASVGFCIERSERAAVYWTDAIRTCLSLVKRLPEPWEWQVACDNAGSLGLNNMVGNYEWASNFAIPMYNGNINGIGAAIFGRDGCGNGSFYWVGSESQSAHGRTSLAFRCVR